MDDNNDDPQQEYVAVKIVLLGESTVGKTCTAVRYTKNSFTECPPTVVASYLSKKVDLDGRLLRYQLWDTAGQERYRAMTHIYYRGAHGALIFYDITKKGTFDGKVDEWVNSVRSETENDISIILVGNKVDDETNREVTTEEGRECAERLGVPFFEISAKEGTCVEEAFLKLGEMIVEKHWDNLKTKKRISPDTVGDLTEKNTSGYSHCC